MAAHYTKAPLTEALIDVRVALPEGTELAQLAVVCDEEAERYPERQKHVSFVSELHINPEEVTSAAASQQKQTGLVVRSKDHLQVMQGTAEDTDHLRRTARQRRSRELIERILDAAVTMLGMPYEYWAAVLFVLLGLAALGVLVRSR